MSGVKKILKKSTRAALKIGGAMVGGLAGGPLGAVAGYKVGGAAGGIVAGGGGGADDVQEPGTPLLDDTSQRRALADRLRRRRGVLANLYGGTASNTAPSVGLKTLTGQ